MPIFWAEITGDHQYVKAPTFHPGSTDPWKERVYERRNIGIALFSDFGTFLVDLMMASVLPIFK